MLSRAALAALAALALTACTRDPLPLAAASGDPVLVELFTSEGCSSCPPADERLAALDRGGVEGTPVVVLGLHVDYWDNLGWKDTFASPAWTARQGAYAAALGKRGLYTPQAVVDGQDDFVGSDDNAARESIRRAARRPKASLSVTRAASANEGTLGLAVRANRLPPGAPADGDSLEVVAALTEDGVTDPVLRGENAGKKLALAQVVRALDARPLAPGGAPTTLTLSPPKDTRRALRAVVFLQERASRRVLGVTAVPVDKL